MCLDYLKNFYINYDILNLLLYPLIKEYLFLINHWNKLKNLHFYKISYFLIYSKKVSDKWIPIHNIHKINHINLLNFYALISSFINKINSKKINEFNTNYYTKYNVLTFNIQSMIFILYKNFYKFLILLYLRNDHKHKIILFSKLLYKNK